MLAHRAVKTRTSPHFQGVITYPDRAGVAHSSAPGSRWFDSMNAPTSDNTIPAARMPAESAGAASRFRPGMTTRVALGFAAIAVAILAANLVTQHSTRTARDRMRQLVVEHEPVTRATESLAGAISVYERVVIDRAERGTGSLKPVDVAAQRVADAAAVYADVTQRNAGDTGVLQQFTSELDAFRAAGGELVHTSTAQRIRAQSYWQQFRELEQLLNAPQDSAGRFAGGVFASESLLELSRLLGVM